MKKHYLANPLRRESEQPLSQPLSLGEGSNGHLPLYAEGRFTLLPLYGGGREGVSPLKRAFTLTEMLVSIIVFVFVMTLAFNTLLASNAVRKAASARIDIYQNGRSVLDVMTRELRGASLRKTDTEFTQGEKVNRALNSLTNTRGRFILNDWPPPKEEASSFGLNPLDTRVYSGNGLDDDGDGQTDEEAYDGIDNDGDGEEDSPTHPRTNTAMADGLDNNGDGFVDEGIDEDIFFPRDMINFMVYDEFIGGADLIEVGYAINPRSGRDLLRRTAYSSTQGNQREQVDGLYTVAIHYAIGERLPVPGISPDLLVPWFDANNPLTAIDPNETGLSFDQSPPLQDTIVQQVELVALNVLGFDCKAYYHDYAIAEENSRRRPPGFDKTVDFTGSDQRFNPYSFPSLSWDSSVEFRNPAGGVDPMGYSLAGPVLPNGADDMALVPGSHRNADFDNQNAQYAAAMAKTDGLPRLVEITLFIQDQFRYREDPIKLNTKVFLPFVTGDE